MAIKKIIYQYDIEGNFIKEWNSVSSALKSIGVTRQVSIMKHKKENEDYSFAYNFYWSFDKKEFLNVPKRDKNGNIRKKFPVYQYDLEGNLIKAWDDLSDIKNELGYSPKRIYEVIYGRKRSSNGFRWTKEYHEKLDDYYDRHIFQYDIYGKFIKEWRNISDIISWNPKITRTNLLSALEGKQKTCKNYQWSYKKFDNIGMVDLYTRKSTVYVYTNNITQEKYVGQTRANIKSRAGKNGNGYKQSTKFWNAIQKYGWNNFSIEIIDRKLEQMDADKLEQYLIEQYDSINNGYNTQTGGILSRVKNNE